MTVGLRKLYSEELCDFCCSWNISGWKK